ncbi:MAG: rhodanese-like domain-containing protein [Ignavibacteriales bacterium]|nr:rhodanese-like domain-containing protein [Ignavibacteriales bacterium]
MNQSEITVEELKKKMDNKEDFLLVDVRESNEKKMSDIGGTLIPVNTLPLRYNELDKEKEIILYCRTGARSGWATNFLRSVGFENVKNLIGGIYAWSDKIDKSVKKY